MPSSLFSVAWKKVWGEHVHDWSIRHRRVGTLVFLPTWQPLTCVTSPDFSWEFGFVSRYLPSLSDCSMSLPPQPITVSTDRPASHCTHSFLGAHHVPEQSASPRHSLPPPDNPTRPVTDHPRLWVRNWRRREMRQQAQVTQLSECRDQGQVRASHSKANALIRPAPPYLGHQFSTLAAQ